jgi:hypothetical protein
MLWAPSTAGAYKALVSVAKQLHRLVRLGERGCINAGILTLVAPDEVQKVAAGKYLRPVVDLYHVAARPRYSRHAWCAVSRGQVNPQVLADRIHK